MKTPKILPLLLFVLFPLLIQGQIIDREQLLQDIKYLSSDELQGRKPLSEGSKKAQKYIKKRFKDLELTSQYQNYTQYFSFNNGGNNIVDAANIIAFIPGEKSQNIIVITAHYDHLGKQDDKIYNGADDNASGTAALMAMAAYFNENRPHHSLIFAALDAEEMGLQGAKALVNDFPFSLDQVILNINMDMISRNDNNELYASGTQHYPQLKPILKEASESAAVKLRFGHDIANSGNDDWTHASDHAAFHDKGIPFIYFGVEDHEDYHQHTDDFEKIDPDFYFNAVDLILNCTKALDENL
ncbi:M28 family peptidase [Echinicola jeungdonensis]|uniref:M28 family peptidase n=1 Tax=Echinicola jeungdonensis TaxID=709343 RepID=A0ABV5J8C4_9BACT|nr:M28 family peptidase [Echinicola jeungdonensis]MDN3669211.1 M28 family peptidase [Echinicola jeungdonensis]